MWAPALRQGSVEMRKADVVTDRQSNRTKVGVDDHRLVAGPKILRLAVRFAVRKVDVEHMDFVVARDHITAPRR